MTIKQLAQAVVAKTAKAWMEERQAQATIKALGAVLGEQLKATGKATIPGLGTLRLHALPEKTSRNPLNGNKLKVPSRKGIEFVADAKLKASV